MKLADAISLINVPGLAGLGSASWADLGAGGGLFSKALASLLAPTFSTFWLDCLDHMPHLFKQATT